MLVSVVIPAYNQAEYLRLAVASALAQTYANLEVIIVDDGSTDHTESTVRTFADPRIRYFRQANDYTFGLGARNRGILESRGDWIALLDQDDLWNADKLARQLTLAGKDKDLGCVFCLANFIDGEGHKIGQQTPEVKDGLVYNHLLRGNSYYASTGLFRRSLLSKAGLPHESSGYADWQLWLSLARHTKVGIVREYLACYRIHASSFQQEQMAYRSFSLATDMWRTLLNHRVRLPDGDIQARRSFRRGMRVNSNLFYKASIDSAKAKDICAVFKAWRMAFICAPLYRILPWIFFRDALSVLWCWVRAPSRTGRKSTARKIG